MTRRGVAAGSGSGHGAKGTAAAPTGPRVTGPSSACETMPTAAQHRGSASHVRTTLRHQGAGSRRSRSASRPASTRPTSSRSCTTARCRTPTWRPGTSRSGARSTAPFTLTWDQFKALPRKTVQTDIHCVTRWSKLDTTWEGVPIQTILEMAGVRPTATHVVSHAEQGYTANLPLSRPRRRRRPPGRHVRRRAARARARLPAPPARPEALLLEEQQVDPRPRVPRPRPARLLGALRLQQRRRPLEGRALQRVAARAAQRA